MAIGVEVRALLNKRIWQLEREKLRALILDCGLEEHVKWGKLCYSFKGSNVVIIYGMKSHCALGFFKGSLLEDRDGVLIQPGKHSQAMRQLRFKSLTEIADNQEEIKSFIQKAIRAEHNGLRVEFGEKDNLEYPDELRDALDSDTKLAEAFEELTPGRQRGYVLHFLEAKQSETRTRRIEKCRPKIMAGKGYSER